MYFQIITIGTVFLQALQITQAAPSASPLPTVDLGYTIHQATANDTASYYNFSNIRYAAAPRFSAPVPINGTNRTINDGQDTAICPQALPLWLGLEYEFLFNTTSQSELTSQYALYNAALAGSNSTTLSNTTIASILQLTPPPSAGTTEDCLTLDVVVPQSVFNSQYGKKKRGEAYGHGSSSSKNPNGAPVLVWIFGGGYIEGDKLLDGSTNGGGLVARSQGNGNDGVIYIAINYRVGIYGWMAGRTFQEDGTANVGLHDQRFALEWIQQNVHLFGGDPDKVTVLGESAGGGSIIHQITAYGGNKGKVPFSQALAQSPGWAPLPTATQQEDMFQKTLQVASVISGRNISTLRQLRTLSDTELYHVNFALIGSAPYGTFFAGPAVDGDFVPALPGQLLLHGKFDKSVKVMSSYNARDGIPFANPFIQDEAAFTSFLQTLLPVASTATLNYITNTLYPPVFNGTYGYTTYLERTANLIQEFLFNCNNQYLNDAFGPESYAYYFAVPPALHTQDKEYTFFGYKDQPALQYGAPVNTTVAVTIQDYILSFAMNQNPNTAYPNIPYFPKWGNNSTMVNMNVTNLGAKIIAPTANKRCAWWQMGLYY